MCATLLCTLAFSFLSCLYISLPFSPPSPISSLSLALSLLSLSLSLFRLLSSGDIRVWSYWAWYVHAAVGTFCRFCQFSLIFADFCRFWQILANFGNFFVNFPGSLGDFRILTQNLEKLDPGAVFAPRECFFRIHRVFLINLA